MANKLHSDQCRMLRHICNRLDTATSAEIPHIASALSSNLPLCCELLSCSDEQLKTFASNAAALSTRYRNQLSSLLQDKSESRKLAAIKLIKATIQIGGYEVIARSGHWVRGLTNCVRSSWVTLRCLAITTLVSVFRLTHGLSNLTREITTPTLPDFVAVCIDSIAPKQRDTGERTVIGSDEYLSCVLSALKVLLPSHPAIFRPFVNQLTTTLGPLIAAEGIERQSRSEHVRTCAQTFHALLPRCATKNEGGPAEKWLNYVRLIERQIQCTAAEVFRSLSLPVNGHDVGQNALQQFASAKSRPEDPPSSEVVDDLCLRKWVGIDAGISRLVDLVHLLEAYMGSKGHVTYSVHLKSIVGVLKLMLSAFPGQHVGDLATVSRAPDVSTEELEALFLQASRIQIAALECLTTVMRRIGPVGKGMACGLLEELLWRLKDYIESPTLRASFYDALRACLNIVGSTMSRSFVVQNEALLKHVVADFFGDTGSKEQINKSAGGKIQSQRHDADAYFQTQNTNSRTLRRNGASCAAVALLETIIRLVPSFSFTSNARAMIDRAAILSRNESLMLASVLNTMSEPLSGKIVASIVPFLAREHPSSLMVEGMIRPRLPVLLSNHLDQRNGGQDAESAYYIAQSEENEEEEEEIEDAEMSNSSTNADIGVPIGAVPNDLHEDDQSLGRVGQRRQDSSGSTFVKGVVPHLPDNATSVGSNEEKYEAIESRRGSIISSGPETKQPLLPSSPKRARPPEKAAPRSVGEESIKRIKLATYEAAPGPTSVSAFVSNEPKIVSAAGNDNDADSDDSASDDSSIPPIIMDADTDGE